MEERDAEYKRRYCQATGISIPDLRSIISSQEKRVKSAAAVDSDRDSLHEARSADISKTGRAIDAAIRSSARFSRMAPDVRTVHGLKHSR